MNRIGLVLLCLIPSLWACGDDGGSDELETIPEGTIACEAPQYWPLSVRSNRHPFMVHYRAPDQESFAREVIGYLEHAWDVQIDQLGFRPPLDDTGQCGPDGALDVFLWGDIDECYANVLAGNAATAYDDAYSYLVVDPWGIYGGDILDSTVAHELNHVFQSADDWSDSATVYEMTATFIEDLVYTEDNQYVDQVKDFQAHPEWSLDHDDGYQTWFMYGSSLYLRYLRDRHFAGSGAFVGDMWMRMRGPAMAGDPDFEDALDGLLQDHAGLDFLATIPDFARWRYYTGPRADAAHFDEGETFAEPARAGTARTTGARIALSPMVLGSGYIDVSRQAGDPAEVRVSLDGADPAVRWVAQVVPGTGTDGDLLDLSAGPVRVAVPAGAATRTLIVTAMPRGAHDPDDDNTARYAATLVLAAP